MPPLSTYSGLLLQIVLQLSRLVRLMSFAGSMKTVRWIPRGQPMACLIYLNEAIRWRAASCTRYQGGKLDHPHKCHRTMTVHTMACLHIALVSTKEPRKLANHRIFAAILTMWSRQRLTLVAILSVLFNQTLSAWLTTLHLYRDTAPEETYPWMKMWHG